MVVGRALAVPQREPLGVCFRNAVRGVCEPVAVREPRPVAGHIAAVVQSEAVIPEDVVAADAIIAVSKRHPAHLEVRPHGLFHLRQRDGLLRWDDRPKLARHVPAHTQIAQQRVHRVQRAALISLPPAGVGMKVTIDAVGDGLPTVAGLLGPDAARARPVLHIRGEQRVRLEVRIATQQHQPTIAGLHAVRAVIQVVVAHAETIRVLASAHVDLHRHAVARLGHDRQRRAADLFDVGLQLLGRELRHPRRRFGADDLGARFAGLDKKRLAARRISAADQHRRRGQNRRKSAFVRSHHGQRVGHIVVIPLGRRQRRGTCKGAHD